MVESVTDPINSHLPAEQLTYRRDGLFCALLMAACFLVAWPFADIGFVDDWSYIKMAQVFAQTGHFAYNGWETPTLGWQVLWGALFIKLFGFSFVHVRLSTLPLAITSVYLFHQILIGFGISRGRAQFGTLVLALSPIFLLMSASYLTDIPGLFCTLLCLYLCQRALAARTDGTALAWLCFATISNVAGGTARQTAFLGVLVIVPCTIWLLRRGRFFWTATLLWSGALVCVFASLRWFYQQPYFQPETVPSDLFARAGIKHLVLNEVSQGARAFLCLLLLLVPVLAMWLPPARSLPRRRLVSISLITLVFVTGILIYADTDAKVQHWLAPWLPHVIAFLGVPGMDILGPKPGPLGYPQRVAITAIVIILTLIVFFDLRGRPRLPVTLSEISLPRAWIEILWLLLPYTVAYGVALSMRAVTESLFDRYLLAPQAVAILLLLRYNQDSSTGQMNIGSASLFGRIPLAGQLALVLIAYYSIAGTHDSFAYERARVKAAEQVRLTGVPRTSIGGGFEYDGWTQLEVGGYINDPRVKNPPDAYHNLAIPEVAPPCRSWFDPTLFPAVKPTYYLAFAPLPCLDRAPFPRVTFLAWMPPFIRHVYVEQRRHEKK